MATSPVEFAAAFERLRNHLATGFDDDSSLLQLLDFWPRLAHLRKNAAYASYIAEFSAFLEDSLRDDNLRDLSIDELTQLEALCMDTGMKDDLLQSVQKQIARQFFFVGKLDEGLAACIRVSKENAIVERRPSPESGLSEFESFRAFANSIDDQWPNTKKLLMDMASEWQSERESVSFDRINCLFVQMTGIGDKSRGRLRALTGSVEERGRSCQNDEVTFDNQLRASDDPMVGVAYQALSATRHYLRSTGHTRVGSVYYHAHFSVADKQTTYTGDSIGIATALLAYAQLLHTEALRHDQLLPGDVACTGGIDEVGMVTPINSDTVHAKVERAFFSHIKYLVLPVDKVALARRYLDTLQTEYPARQLVLLPVNSLSAAVNDHNIVRPEKVCIGEFVAKKAVKYSRMTKVQVPMLMLLAYLLLCVISPKTFWFWFDGNPSSLKLIGNRIEVLNQAGDFLWSREFPDSLPSTVKNNYQLASIDDDDNREVLVLLFHHGLSISGGMLRVFDDDGDSLFAISSILRGKYPGDSVANDVPVALEGGEVQVKSYCGSPIIITTMNAQNPARCYVQFWTRGGDKLGNYINSGFAYMSHFEDFDQDGTEEALICGTNNRLNCISLLTLDPATADGVSPPYDDVHGLDLTRVTRGTQERLVFIYPSDVNKFSQFAVYQGLTIIRKLPNNILEVSSRECGDIKAPAGIDYYFNFDLHLTWLAPNDFYSKQLHLLREEGKLPNLPDEVFLDSAKNRVTYYENGSYVSDGQRLLLEHSSDSSHHFSD